MARKLARDGIASKRSITHAILGLFLETMTYTQAFHVCDAVLNSFFYAYSATADSLVIVSLFLRTLNSAVLWLPDKLSLC